MECSCQDLVSRLRLNLDAHLMTLKFLTLLESTIRCQLVEDDSGWASMAVMAVNDFAWDRQTYPWARSVAFLDGNSPSALRTLFDRLPPGPLVIKSTDPETLTFLRSRLGESLLRTFLWYTTQKPLSVAPEAVRIVDGPGDELDQFLQENGYTASEVSSFWSRGARGFVASSNGQARSFCLVYPNFDRVWEVGSLKTREEYRQQGWGKRVVAPAINYLLENNLRPRYHVDSQNTASCALAESLGMHVHMRALHFAVVNPDS